MNRLLLISLCMLAMMGQANLTGAQKEDIQPADLQMQKQVIRDLK